MHYGSCHSPSLFAVQFWLGLALTLGSMAALADARQDTPAMLRLSVGQTGIDTAEGREPWHIGLDYRWQPMGSWELVPSIGVLWINGGAHYVYAELKRDFLFDNGWVLTPSFAAGAFDDSEELQLGNELEFRSGLELGYRFDNHYRLGLGVFHTSNGGISDKNPGTESVLLSLSMPM
ncbi:acyloxyacyl hydrolase [Shewanella cyperi]|uniref:Acyloxyacyl hydrolase n=1 Tax=Shewanella cyperi TaxID=2814292 RepID=A0A974XMA0_9GAMM|nr:acyloxyacyl hydrolase [Shewanella cyperi]QSX31011.1 acyloxyacyl hydrolase [Shewanella cyperi]